jgi:hypothetical protein
VCSSHLELHGADSADWQPRKWIVWVRDDEAPTYPITVPSAIGPRDAERQAQEQLREYAIAARVVKVETA